jgi:hypothetical protein
MIDRYSPCARIGSKCPNSPEARPLIHLKVFARRERLLNGNKEDGMLNAKSAFVLALLCRMEAVRIRRL